MSQALSKILKETKVPQFRGEATIPQSALI